MKYEELLLHLASAQVHFSQTPSPDHWSFSWAEYINNHLAHPIDDLAMLLRDADTHYHQTDTQHPYIHSLAEYISLALEKTLS